MKPTFLLVASIMALTAGELFSADALVSVGPAKLTLRATKIDDPTGWQTLVLSISNRTNRKWHFSNFYESWSPILLSADGKVIRLDFARDATLPPRPADYPLLGPGDRVTAKRGCRAIRTEQGLTLIVSDGTGGLFSAPVVPGAYKLCASYRFDWNDGLLFHLATEHFGLQRAQVWPGWTVSNWIDITIQGEPQ